MKQQIICQKCETDLKKKYPSGITPYPGEHIKFVDGTAKFHYRCDTCGEEIAAGSPCCAFSIWSDHGAQPYYPWEEDYINIKKEE